MKILGEKSLSSKVIVGLKALFGIISIIDILVLSIILKVIRHLSKLENVSGNIFDLSLFTIMILSGIIALFIIYQFIKIFNNLKNNILFSKDSSNRLNTIGNSCILISIVYCIITILIFFMIKSLDEGVIYFMFALAIILAIVFIVFGIGMKILNEIYKKAIKYKEENDFVI